MDREQLRAKAEQARKDPRVAKVLTRLRHRIADAVQEAQDELRDLGVDDHTLDFMGFDELGMER